MFNNFIVKALLKKQLKGLPQDVQDKVIALIEKNPQLFMEIGTEVKKKMDAGMDQEKAVREVMESRGGELKALL